MSSRKKKSKFHFDDPREGLVFEKKGYEVTDLINEGAFGKVYKALNMKDNVMAAVKVMDTTKMATKVVDELLPRELEIMQVLNHRNILKTFDIIKMNKKIFIFMEFAGGGSLKDKVKNQPQDLSDIKKWFRQTAEALCYMHNDMRIAHLDIKPDNVLLDNDEDAKLSDFGFSRFLESDDERITTMLGTLPYYSPQLIARKHNPFKSDTWAMGVLLYALSTGRIPWRKVCKSLKAEKNEWKKFYLEQTSRAYRDSEEFRNVEPLTRNLIHRLLDPDEEKRLTARQILRHEWFRSTSSSRRRSTK